MRKFTWLLLLVAALMMVVVGCGKKPDVEPETQNIENPGGRGNEDPGSMEPPDQPPPILSEDVDFQTIYFDFDKYNLKSNAMQGLQYNFDQMQKNSDLRVLIEGHCDERGTVEYNLALGERRARAAMDYLINLGISPSRLSVISYGKERPAVMGHDESAWAKNRRCEFVVTGR